MSSGPSGYSDPSAPLKDDPQQPASLTPRFPTNVTAVAAPVKRITFFKSGDLQFSGVRMAIHNRSFKCFDALLDDLSQKVPLPFGVRTITTPRGIHSIKRLEQLEDGGCYLCSDRRFAKPINMELAGKRPVMWHHHSRPSSGRHKPSRPEEAVPERISPHYYRHPKRIVLVKNTDPSVRRSIILSRRTARSLRVFMEEVSELMQYHVKKLYTIEGRKVDSIQTLMHCPNVLVCVGRETFRPLMVECRKNSEEKLPGMSARSRSSLCSEGHDSKKNVNFGLETKKSIIHPRSDSSNRSTRFSLSSEKSYPNGLCTPGQTGYVVHCPHSKETIINDDIEKRVLVNKDGSLSVEMKVRFRLTNDETLKWSTEIKKSPGVTNTNFDDKEANPHYLQQGKESSEQESSGEVEEVFASKLRPGKMEESCCENCCNHCQEYDIWKNPMHREHHRSTRHIKSSSSSGSSHKIVRKKASVDSIRTISRSSEEYTEHVVKKASCYQQTVEGGDTMVEYCTISRCCSRSEVSAMATTSKSKRSQAERCDGEGKMTHNGGKRPDTAEQEHYHSSMCCVEVTKASDGEDRPFSAVSNSSKVLESLKEDEDDDYDDLPPSASRASLCSQGEQENKSSRAKGHSKMSDQRLLSPKQSEVSACSERSSKHKVKSISPTPADQQQNSPIPNSRPESTASRNSSKCLSCYCRAASQQSSVSNAPDNAEEGDRPQSTVSKSSETSRKSHNSLKDRSHSPGSAALNAQLAKDEGEEEEEERTVSAMSGASRGSGVCPHCGGCNRETESASRQSEEPTDKIEEPIDKTEENQADEEAEEKPPSVMSTRSARSAASVKSERSSKHHVSSRGTTPVSATAEVEANGGEEAVPNDRVESALSNHSNASAVSKKSNRSVCSNCRRSSVAESVAMEEKSGSDCLDKEALEEERVSSSLSDKSRVSNKSNCSTSNRAKTPRSNHSGSPAPINDAVEGRDGAISAQSNTSQASRVSGKSHGGEVKQAESQASDAPEKQDTEEGPDEVIDDKVVDERATSGMSDRTDASVKSHKSNCSASKRAKSPAPKNPGDAGVTEDENKIENRADSAMSARSNISAASRKSTRPQSKASERAASQTSAVSEICQQETEEPEAERAASALSNKSKASIRSNLSPKQSCSDEEPLPAEENPAKAAEEPEEDSRAPSAMSSASVRSRASHKSVCSTSSRAKSPRAATPKAPEAEGENAEEERAASVMSNKTDASGKSRATQKSVLPVPDRGRSPRPRSPARVKQENNENEAVKRPASSLSVKSDVPRTSRQSKRGTSPASLSPDVINSAPEERSSSAMSKKSGKSPKKTDEETTAEEKAPSETVMEDDASNFETAEPSANSNTAGGEEKEERAASAMSNKTNTSAKSRVSHKSTLHASDKAQTARAKSPAPSDRLKEDGTEKRSLSSLSVRTDASRSSRKSQGKEAKRSPSPAAQQRGGQETEERPTSAMSNKSTKSSKNQCKEENEVQERAPSAMSGKTTASVKSSKSQKASHNPDVHADEEAEQRPESAMSQTSDQKSLKGASERAATPVEPSDAPAGQEVKQAVEEDSVRSKSALSVASHTSRKSTRAPSPRPKSSQSKTSKAEEKPRASSAMSTNSKVSSKSKKCQCSHSKDTPPKTPEATRSKTSKMPPEISQPENTEKPSTPDSTVITTPEPDEGQEETVGSTITVTLDTEQNRPESVKSTRSSTKSKAGGLKRETGDRSPSALSPSSTVTRSKSPSPTKTKEPFAENQTEDTGASKTLNVSRPKSSASVRSEKSTKSHNKDTKTNDLSKETSYLNIKVPITDIDGKSENGSVKSFKSTKKPKSVKFDKNSEEKTSRSNSGSASDGSQNCLNPAQEQPNKNTPPTIRLTSTSSDSVLSNALSAADLLRELSVNTRPESRNSQSAAEKQNDRLETKSNKSSKNKKVSSSQKNEQSSLELVQSCLPNASPTDVVNEWLKNIPGDGSMYQMEDELNEHEKTPQVETVENAEESVPNENEQEAEEEAKLEENATGPCGEKEGAPEETSEPDEDGADNDDMADPCGETANKAEESYTDTAHPKTNPDSPKKQPLSKRSNSSIQVMKALLSPKLDRCNSLPEVSPVYGRKLSRSARGLLDCLAKLRFIDSDPTNSQYVKYSEIMNILQTLWLYDPTDEDQMTQRGKDHSPTEDETNPRSSSGVDVSSGSDESAKSMANSGEEKVASELPTLIIEHLSVSEVYDERAVGGEEAEEENPTEPPPEEGDDAPGLTAASENEDAVSDAVTPDVAARVQGSRADSGEPSDEDDAENVATEEGAESPESPKESAETVQSPNETSSSRKETRTANETESNPPANSSSGTPPSAQRAQLARKVSQDPDPVWVLSLLKKVEKQFMTHYTNAMAEFKVRWDLDDNVMLDTMINELKVEVQKRIQDSIKRELQKIQGRAGKSPRPPVAALSNESSVQTEQRRRRLKVMRNQSNKPSGSDVASGTDFSDQRSDDEYCPCDACVRKKMEAKQVLRAELLNTAPVKMEFDLRKILQLKRDPPPAPKVEQPPPKQSSPETEEQESKEEAGNLDVVQEEPEQEGDVPEKICAEGEEEPNEMDETGDGEAEEEDEEGDAADGGEQEDEGDGGEAEAAEETVNEEEEEEEGEGESTENTKENVQTEEEEDEEAAELEIAEEEAGEDIEDEEAEVKQEDDEGVDGSGEEDGPDNAEDQQLSKDGTEDEEAIAENTPVNDTEGDADGNQGDSIEAVDEIEEDEETEKAGDAEGDAPVQSDTSVVEEAQDQAEGEEEAEEETVASSKPARGDSWEQFRNRQMTRTSVESQPGSMDSVELELEAKQIVQSVFTSIHGHKTDRDELDEGLKTTSRKRSRSPARANKPRRPKDSDIKVDDLEF